MPSRFLLLLLTLSLYTINAYAERPLVVFFGGHGATTDQVNQWKRAVQARMPDYDVEAIPYPRGAGSSREAAIAGGRADVTRLAALINAKPGRQVVIAGHSSGAALSNDLAMKLASPRNVRLVSIDGFAPNAYLMGRFQTECWSAVNASGAGSRNRNAMRNACGNRYREIRSTVPGCTTAWCLHFATFNRGADYRNNWGGGYGNMNPVLDWIRPGSSSDTPVASAPTPPGRPGSSTFMSGDPDIGNR